MASVIQSNFRARRSYATSKCIVDVPNLIDIQRRSYEAFLQADVPPEERTETGLQGVFKSIFPIRDFNETSELDFVSYTLEEPKYDVEECHTRGMTYEAPVKVDVRLTVFDRDEDGNRSIHDIQEQFCACGPHLWKHRKYSRHELCNQVSSCLYDAWQVL